MDGKGRRARRRVAVALLLASTLVTASGPVVLAGGKPGYPDRVTWSGASWQIKTSRSPVGPGPCRYDKSNVAVDPAGQLHLHVRRLGSAWTCAEIIGPTSHGYGTYTFTLASDVSALDPNVVLGLFTWSDRAPYAHREIDIEFARWGNATDATNAQFVLQPDDVEGHLRRFAQPSATTSTHSFTWRPGSVTWESRDANGALIASHAYAGNDVPVPGDERVRLNLWLFGGTAPTSGQSVEVVVRSFAFAT